MIIRYIGCTDSNIDMFCDSCENQTNLKACKIFREDRHLIESESLTLKQAIKALNSNLVITHQFLNNNYLIKNQTVDLEVIHGIECGWDVISDPYHEGDTYYMEYIFPVNVYNKEGVLVNQNPKFSWKNDESRRNFPLDGWRIKI